MNYKKEKEKEKGGRGVHKSDTYVKYICYLRLILNIVV
jgi:hypothetical protein